MLKLPSPYNATLSWKSESICIYYFLYGKALLLLYKSRILFSLTDIVLNLFTFIVLLYSVIADSNKAQSGYEMLSSDHFSWRVHFPRHYESPWMQVIALLILGRC